MLGHLSAARALYQSGEAHEASEHLAHPVAERLSVVRSALKQRGLDDVAARIEELAESAEDEPAWSEVADAHESAQSAVERAMRDVPEAKRNDAAFQAKVLTALLLQARHEYEEAVEGDRIAHPYEYRGSWGFVQVGRQLLEQHAETFRSGSGDYDALVERYEAAMAAWPSIAVPEEAPMSVSQLYGRVAAFEFVASQY